jgi:acetyl esterase/lipase
VKPNPTAAAALFCGLLASSAAPGARAQTVNLWPGPAPGSEGWTHREATVEDTPLGAVVFNVVTPTLTAYLPDRAHGQGPATGVVIAPGGAFVALAIEHEGRSVARWLQARGVAAFVLKYRILEKRGEGIPAGLDPDAAARYGVADAVQALRLVRRRAPEWGVAPERVGLLGFSAGAMVASGALLDPDASARPSFAGLVYGARFGAMPAIPNELPRVFMAWAKDDGVARAPAARFRDALLAAGHRPEVHVYGAGGHGFGLRQQGSASDRWIDDFLLWLRTLSPPAPSRPRSRPPPRPGPGPR